MIIDPDEDVLIPRSLRLAMLANPTSAAELEFLDVYRCRRCSHDWEDHDPLGAVPPSKSKCQLAGCECARFAQDGDVLGSTVGQPVDPYRWSGGT